MNILYPLLLAIIIILLVSSSNTTPIIPYQPPSFLHPHLLRPEETPEPFYDPFYYDYDPYGWYPSRSSYWDYFDPYYWWGYPSRSWSYGNTSQQPPSTMSPKIRSLNKKYPNTLFVTKNEWANNKRTWGGSNYKGNIRVLGSNKLVRKARK